MYSVTDSYKRTGIRIDFLNGIKDWNQLLSELFQSQVVDRNPVLFDPPGLFHVGQPEYPEGNCYEHHIEMGENPCTPRIVCDLREEFRTNAARIKVNQDRPNHNKKEKDHTQTQSGRYDKELEQFEKWRLKEAFY